MAHERFARALRDLRANCPEFTVLSLNEGNNIGDEQACALASALSVNSTLHTLYLWRNNIGDKGARALAEALRVNFTLRELDLWRNNIGDEGASALAEALRVNSTLRALNLFGGNIGDEGARALAEALRVNSTLRELNLWHNNIGAEGVRALAEALRVHSTLRKLLMDDGSEEIRRYLRRNQHNARARATPLKIRCWKALLELNDPKQTALVPPLLRENSTSLLSKIDSKFPFY